MSRRATVTIVGWLALIKTTDVCICTAVRTNPITPAAFTFTIDVHFLQSSLFEFANYVIMPTFVVFLVFLWSSFYITPEWLFLLIDCFMELHLQYLNSWLINASKQEGSGFNSDMRLKTYYLETKSLTWCTLVRWLDDLPWPEFQKSQTSFVFTKTAFLLHVLTFFAKLFALALLLVKTKVQIT